MPVPIKITGVEAHVRVVAEKKENARIKIYDGLMEAGAIILRKALKYVPVETGRLYRSGRVEGYKKSGFGSYVKVIFGNEKAFYALWVHEHVWKYHEPPGCAKFLERAYRETRGTTTFVVSRRLKIGSHRLIDGEEVPRIYE